MSTAFEWRESAMARRRYDDHAPNPERARARSVAPSEPMPWRGQVRRDEARRR